MKNTNEIYVIMFQGIIDDITNLWGERLESIYGFFTDRKEAEAFRDKLNADNGFEYDISEDDTQYYFVGAIEAHKK